MLIGLLAGLATGALWGLTFVAPRAVQPFTELDLAMSRYAIFGLVSLALMIHPRFRPNRVTGRQFRAAIFLGAMGYVGYYVLAAYAVRLAGLAIPPLIIGALPIALAIYGNWQNAHVKWSSLALPLGMILVGLAIVNISTLSSAGDAEQRSDILLGTLCAIGAFAIWMVYGVLNSKMMLSADAPDTFVWTGLQGVGALLTTLPLVPVAILGNITAFPTHALSSPEGLRFVAWSVLLGVAGSWLATWFWVIASKKLPLALSAQLIVTETIFALIYGFAYDGRWPTFHEWLGTIILISGVIGGVRLFRRQDEVAVG